jgi:hypothetical protein
MQLGSTSASEAKGDDFWGFLKNSDFISPW